MHAAYQERALRFSLTRALSAFDKGDVDLAQRSLIASLHHHSKAKPNRQEQLALLWCLAWFAFYEGRSSAAEALAKRIQFIQENSAKPCAAKLTHTLFVLSIFCRAQNKISEADEYVRSCLSMIETEKGTKTWSYSALSTALEEFKLAS
jgi:hypothetical protein